VFEISVAVRKGNEAFKHDLDAALDRSSIPEDPKADDSLIKRPDQLRSPAVLR